ncbi:MAG: gamma-glutamyltransferase family protein [Chloroflexi bacterium]|nr:gamma-glutamyltransferase family protein [Chloroflexota bacterium]
MADSSNPTLNLVGLPLGAPGPHADMRMPACGPILGRRGVVASANHLASLAGLDVMRNGGNAIDATIATSAVMIIVQPYSSHLGGDAFATIRTASGETLAVNSGGRASRNASPDDYPDGIPMRGATAVAVPGLVDAWCTAHERLGTKPMSELLAPAVQLARDGFPVTRMLAGVIANLQDLLATDVGCREVFLSDGPPRQGAILKQPDLAQTLEAIASGGRFAFYSGDIGQRIIECLQAGGSKLDADDFAQDQAVWGEPLSIDYRGWKVYEQPLPSQGFVTLEALNIIEGFDVDDASPTDPEVVHRAAEAIRLAFYDRIAHAGDPDIVDMPIERLLSKTYAAEQRQRIDDGRPAVTTHGGDTTSFAVADGEGNLVSFIQSTFQPFGAAVLVPGTGVMMNDRMYGFSNDPESPNVVRPGARTNHTLNSWLLERDDGLVYAGGTPGADYQVQINLQMISSIVDFKMNAQAAISAPKWALTGPGDLSLEGRFPDETFAALAGLGHTVVRGNAWEGTLCRCQIVGRTADGVLYGASDPRAEGSALSI